MNAKILFLVLFSISLLSCNSKTKNIAKKEMTDEKVVQKIDTKTVDTEGLELMKQKCFICHFKTPDHSRHDQMIAPPMMRVQEHYLPNYPKKDDFVKAIVEWVKNPKEENTLMPGALRKFKLMPKLVYEDTDIQKIAEYLYSMDFGDAPKMRGHNAAISLNDGEKWKLNKETMKTMQDISKKLKAFESQDIKAYNQLGKDVFQSAKTILIGDTYSGGTFDQLQNFFHKVEPDMHALTSAKSIPDAQGLVKKLQMKFNKFNTFFE